MKKLLFFIILIGLGFHNQAQNYAWVKSMGGTSYEMGHSIAVDAAGNIYTTGIFQGTVDFDPGAGIFNITSVGGSKDIFVSKLDASGNFVWAKNIGGAGPDEGNGIALDAFGNVYTTGYFYGPADFDPGASIFNLTSTGTGKQTFVSKLDTSGNFLWAKSMGGTFQSHTIGNSIAVDTAENVYTTGVFSGTVDFDPGAGTVNLTSLAGGGGDIFVSKLDASGNFVWVKSLGGSTFDYGNSIAVDDSGYVYTTGELGVHIFVSKLDALGNSVWLKNMTGTGGGKDGNGIAVDSSGNVYTTGFFQATVDFDPGAGIFNLTAGNSSHIFVSKLDASGNFLWAKSMGGTAYPTGTSIALDTVGNVYTTGYFDGTVDFDPGAGINTLSSAGAIDIFVTKLTTLGNFVWAKSMGGTQNDLGYSIALDSSGNVYTTGYFQGTADFDPGAGIETLSPVGLKDIFVAKLGCPSFTTDVQTACDSIIWIDGNTYYTNTNTPSFTLTNAAGCDSIVTLNLTFGNPNSGTDVVTACDSITWIDGNTYYTNTNTPNFTLTNASGCDSVVTLNLTFGNPNSGTDVVTACDSITWIDGLIYTASTNTPVFVVTNASGCDSVVTLNLTILNSTTGVDTQVACDSISWIDNVTYTSSTNTPTFTLTNTAGCDSVVTLDLTINNNTGTDTRVACDSLTWIDGITYISSNNTVTFNIVAGNSNGCDSLVTLDLTINNSSIGTDIRIECNSLVWIDGTTYTSSNNTAIFNIVGGNTNGCDSLVTLDLTISNLDANYTPTDNGNGNYSFTNNSTGNFNQSHWGFGDGTIDSIANPNHTFTTNGVFTVILTIQDSTVLGDSCVSYFIDTINVTGVSNPLPCNSGFVIYPDTTGNVTIINNGTGTNLTYSWDFGDGNTSTLQNPSHTYATAGPFYLCLTIDDGNGCADMYCDSIGKNGVIFNKTGGFTINVSSPNTTGIDKVNLNSEIKIYPNPTSNKLTIDTELNINEINIIDITGKIIMVTKENTSTINVTGLSNGIYFIQLVSEDRTITKKFVKQ